MLKIIGSQNQLVLHLRSSFLSSLSNVRENPTEQHLIRHKGSRPVNEQKHFPFTHGEFGSVTINFSQFASRKKIMPFLFFTSNHSVIFMLLSFTRVFIVVLKILDSPFAEQTFFFPC